MLKIWNIIPIMLIQTLQKKVERFLFPYLCVLCLGKSDTTRDLCSSCEIELPKLSVGCQQCGVRLNVNNTEEKNLLICGDCLKHPPSYDAIIPLYEYIEPVDSLILRLKFGKKLLYANVLGELMADTLFKKYAGQSRPQCIIPVPLHLKRLQERGFNQSMELSRPIAKKLGLPIEFFLCERIKNTNQQSNTPIKKRKLNVEHAFAFVNKAKKNYQSVAIVDDVVTTGHTVNALSQVLKANGVREVVVWCCARTCL